MPGGGRSCAADRTRTSGQGRGARAQPRGGGPRVLLSLGRRLSVAAVALAVALFPQTASAHAELLQANPQPNSVLEAAPDGVTLVFSEPVTPAGGGIEVFSPSGRQVAGPVFIEGPELGAALAATEVGTYVVSWQVFAADTHPSRGAFSFAVGRTSGNPYSGLLDVGVAGTATPVGLALQTVARWVHFIGFALAFGVIAYGVVAIRRDVRPRRLVGTGVLLLVVAEPLALLAQLASLSFDGDTALAVLGSNFGRLLGLRLGAALLTWALIATGRSWPIVVVGAIDAILDGASAHAIPGLPGAGPLLVAVHVGAMGLWVGGLAAFVLEPDARFARYAIATLGTAVVTGALLALAHTHLGGALLTTDYGRALLLKVLLVAAAVSAVALRRHLAELAFAIVIVGAAALVAALPPPF